MEQTKELDVASLGVDDEVRATGAELASPFWYKLVTEMLGKEAVAALHAKFDSRTRGYVVELVGNRGYQKLRGYHLIAPGITSAPGKGGEGEYSEKVEQIAADRMNMVFISLGEESLRIYYFKAF